MNTETKFAPAKRLSPEEIQKQGNTVQLSSAISFLSILPHPLLILNEYRQMVYCNEAFSKLVAPDVPEAGSRPGEIFHCVHSQLMPGGCGTSSFCRYCGAVIAIMNAIKGKDDHGECQILQQRKNRTTTLDVAIWAKSFDIASENFVLLTLHDMSHANKLMMLEKIFFHDILNTVSGIKGLTEILDHEDENADWARDMLSNSIKELEAEIKSHRLLVQAEAKELEVNKTIVSAKQILSSVAAFYEKTAMLGEKELSINTDNDFSFYSDIIILKRVLGNMIKNALEASTPGDRAEAGFYKDKNNLVFRVWNREAMSEEVQSHIFKRAFSTKGKNRGIGTYSIKMLTEDYLDGRAWFESNPDTGTTFYVSLPLGKQP